MTFSISDVIEQNTAGFSEGYPAGVPAGYAWYRGMYMPPGGYSPPPADFTAVTGWAHVYQEAGAPPYSNPSATVEVANTRTYVHLRSTGEWVLVQDQGTNRIAGGHFVADFGGNAAIPMRINTLPDGSAQLGVPPPGYNDHFWPTNRGVYPAGAVDAVYVQMDMRVSDPNLNLIAQVGADWWRNASAGYVDGFSNNPGVGVNNWVELSTQWTTLAFYSSSTAQIQANPPPPLLGSLEPRPTITSFSSDSGTVGDRITNDATLTLAGTAEASSTVRVFDGAIQIGTTRANASGVWSLTTGQLSNGTHSLTAQAIDTAGNSSPASSAFSVRVDTAAPPGPRITSFSPDSSPAGDRITNASVLTLAGTAEAGSAVRVFDGATHIGTATTNASGAWTFTTASLSNANHSFSATATDVAGNTSAVSSDFDVRVQGSTSPPPSGGNLLVNGSFEESSVRANRWEGFSSIPGWTALTGGTIELWNNMYGVHATNGVNFGELDFLSGRDGFYQDLGTVAGQSYSLSFDARSRFPGSTSTIEVLWNDAVVAIVPPANSWTTYSFTVTGTGGQDRLTFREAQGESADGLGALYDNVSLVAARSFSSTQSSMGSVRAISREELSDYAGVMQTIIQDTPGGAENPFLVGLAIFADEGANLVGGATC